MESHFEINVALNGRHFFATAPRSARWEEDAKKLYKEIKTRFPEKDGFEVSVTEWKGTGHGVKFD